MKVTKFIYQDIYKREINIGDNILFKTRSFNLYGYDCLISLGIINDLLQPIVLDECMNYNTIDGSLYLDCYKLPNMYENYLDKYVYYLENNFRNKNYDIFNKNLCVGSFVLYFENGTCNYKPIYALMISNNTVFTLNTEVVTVNTVYLIENPTDEEKRIYKNLITTYKNLFLE